MDIMIEFRGYKASVNFDESTFLFEGRIVNIESVITFQGKSLETTKTAFKKAVNDHIVWCEKYPQTSETLFQKEG